MRTSQFGVEARWFAVHAVEAGWSVTEVCGAFGIARLTYYRWKASLEPLRAGVAEEQRRAPAALRAARLAPAQLREAVGAVLASWGQPTPRADEVRALRAAEVARDEARLRERLVVLARAHPRWRYRRLHAALVDGGHPAGLRRTYRLYGEAGLALHRKPKKPFAAEVRGVPAPATGPNARWDLAFAEYVLPNGLRRTAWRLVDGDGTVLFAEVHSRFRRHALVRLLLQLARDRGAPAAIQLEGYHEDLARHVDQWAARHDVAFYRRPARESTFAALVQGLEGEHPRPLVERALGAGHPTSPM